MSGDGLLVLLLGLGLGGGAVLPYMLRRRRLERASAEAQRVARDYGLHEPASLHPVVDVDRCIGSGTCVAVCPEDVLGLVAGQAVAVAPARCVGHGLCERVCPVEAIRLVFGTATRGVELPRVKEDYETNVPGLHIVGELGGMGLIRNAFEQGRQCMEAIRARPDARDGGGGGADPEELDVVIVGCGPAGLSASLAARRLGLRVATLEKEPDVGGTVRHYPRRKLVMTSPFEIPGWGKVRAKEIAKEELVSLWSDVIGRTGLEVRTGEEVRAVRRQDGGFRVETSAAVHHSRRVVLAIGRRGVPRKLGVPGEETGNVYYALAEPEVFRDRRVTVVGGGDSAVEAALALSAEPGTEVRLSYRRDRLSRVKPLNLERFLAAVSEGRIRSLWNSEVREIGSGSIVLEDADGVRPLPNDDVFVFIGGELPMAFLRACGVELETKFGAP